MNPRPPARDVENALCRITSHAPEAMAEVLAEYRTAGATLRAEIECLRAENERLRAGAPEPTIPDEPPLPPFPAWAWRQRRAGDAWRAFYQTRDAMAAGRRAAAQEAAEGGR